MIFAAVFFPWLFLASKPSDLILLAAAAVIRVLYVQARIPPVSAAVIIMWFVVTLLGAAYYSGEGARIDYAIVVFCKLSLGSFVLLHLVHQFLHSPMRRFPGLRQIWLYFGRSFEILRAKFEETSFWVGQRLRFTFRRKDLGWLSWFRKLWIGAVLVAQGVVSILAQLVQLENGLNVVVASRGSFPKDHHWIALTRQDGTRWWALSVADVILACGLLLPVLYGERSIVPNAILDEAARRGIIQAELAPQTPNPPPFTTR